MPRGRFRIRHKRPFFLEYTFRLPTDYTDVNHIKDKLRLSDFSLITLYYKRLPSPTPARVQVYFYAVRSSDSKLKESSLRNFEVNGLKPIYHDQESSKSIFSGLEANPDVCKILTDQDLSDVFARSEDISIDPKPVSPPLDAPDSVSSDLLQKFLATDHGPVSHLAKAFSQDITKTQRLGKLPLDIRPDRPSVFSIQGRWIAKPSDQEVIGRAITSMSAGSAYRRDQAIDSLVGGAAYAAHHDVIVCLSSPDPKHTPFVFNIPLINDDEESEGSNGVGWIAAPPEIEDDSKTHLASRSPLSANIVPTYGFADLHIDVGQRVVSAVIGSCLKLWAIYPPSSANLDALFTACDQKCKFTLVHDKLTEGFYTVTDSTQAVYIPAGWIHAVYTLSGGVLVGHNWVCDTDVAIIADIFIREVDCGEYEAGRSTSKDVLPLLWAILESLKSLEQQKFDPAIYAWCRTRHRVRRLVPAAGRREKPQEISALEDIRKALRLYPDRACSGCHASSLALAETIKKRKRAD